MEAHHSFSSKHTGCSVQLLHLLSALLDRPQARPANAASAATTSPSYSATAKKAVNPTPLSGKVQAERVTTTTTAPRAPRPPKPAFCNHPRTSLASRQEARVIVRTRRPLSCNYWPVGLALRDLNLALASLAVRIHAVDTTRSGHYVLYPESPSSAEQLLALKSVLEPVFRDKVACFQLSGSDDQRISFELDKPWHGVVLHAAPLRLVDLITTDEDRTSKTDVGKGLEEFMCEGLMASNAHMSSLKDVCRRVTILAGSGVFDEVEPDVSLCLSIRLDLDDEKVAAQLLSGDTFFNGHQLRTSRYKPRFGRKAAVAGRE